MKQPQIRFGLMPVFDAALELPRTVLPLKSVRYQFVAQCGMAEVEMTQIYCQENAQPLDCEYLFPLPADAAIYRCEAVINGRIISARVEEREAARKLVETKKAEGYRTAMVESERDNLFTLSLGNLQPQDLIEIKLAYVQPLRRLAGEVALDLPLCPGVRYIPGNTLLRSNRGTGIEDDTHQVPDASRISPPRIDGAHPDAAYIDLQGQIDAAFLDGKVRSPSHDLVGKRSGKMLNVTLKHGGDIPDRDLALRWTEQKTDQTVLRGWTSLDDGTVYAMLEMRAPDRMVSSNVIAQDFYFLVDRSGSMEGMKWEKAIQALHGCIATLNPNDRAMVTLFESTFHDFDAEPVSPAVLMSDPRFQQLASLGTTGGTALKTSMGHVLEQVTRFSTGRPAALVLITDAEIGNEDEITDLMRQHPTLPVHCFGIDTSLNDSLLLDLVRQQGGTWHALQPTDDIAAIVTQLGRTLRQPVLVNLQVPNGWELAAGSIPNLYAGQINFVSLRSMGAPSTSVLSVRGVDQNNASVCLDFQLTPVHEQGPCLRWRKVRLVALMAKNDKPAAIALSKEANLICGLTAFVAWDAAEKVAIADHRLVQPAMEMERCMISSEENSEAMLPPSSCVMACVAPEPYKPAVVEKSKILQRIRSLQAHGPASTQNKLDRLLITLIAWVEQETDMTKIASVESLLDMCAGYFLAWGRCEEKLHKLTAQIADDMDHTSAKLRETWHTSFGQAEKLDQLRSLVSRDLLENSRQEAMSIISEMTHMEQKLRNEITEFLDWYRYPKHAGDTAHKKTIH